MRRKLLAIVFGVVAPLSCLGQNANRVAVVVSSASPVANITMARVREIYRCDKSSWPNGRRISPFTRASGTPEHSVMLRALGMQEGDYRQYLVMKQMKGELECRVTELPSKGMMMEALRSYPGAIALIRTSDLTPDMKVLPVDGHKPEDPEYPLQ